jgi:hypothetical protein
MWPRGEGQPEILLGYSVDIGRKTGRNTVSIVRERPDHKKTKPCTYHLDGVFGDVLYSITYDST